MAYDPQSSRPRPRPSTQDASIVDALIDGADTSPPTNGHRAEAAPPVDAPVAQPPRSRSERLLYSLGFSTVLSAAASVVVLYVMWRVFKRLRRRLRG